MSFSCRRNEAASSSLSGRGSPSWLAMCMFKLVMVYYLLSERSDITWMKRKNNTTKLMKKANVLKVKGTIIDMFDDNHMFSYKTITINVLQPQSPFICNITHLSA